MRKIKSNHENDIHKTRLRLYVQDEHENELLNPNGCIDYYSEGADDNDMGWFGYFVGKSEHLDILSFEPTSGSSIRDVIGPFFRGVHSNKSI